MHAMLQGFGENTSPNFEAAIHARKTWTFHERIGDSYAIHRLNSKSSSSIIVNVIRIVKEYHNRTKSLVMHLVIEHP